MASASKAKLVALFITAREMIPHRQTLIDMDGPNQKALSKWITQQLLGRPTINCSLPEQDDGYANLVALVPCFPRLILILLGCRKKTGPTTTPSNTRTPTIKRIDLHMQVSGTSTAHNLPPDQPWSHGFLLTGFPIFFLHF